MTSRVRYLMVLASLALGACAAPTVAPSTTRFDTTTVVPLPDYPRLTRAEMKANPPHPDVLYEDYTMEPTRFIFKPRNLPPEEHPGNDPVNGDYGDYGYEDYGGGMDGGF